jgi:hypothetical protein
MFMQRTGVDPTRYGENGMVKAISDALANPAMGLRLLGIGSQGDR